MTEKRKPTKLHHLKPADGSKKRKIRIGRGDAARRGAKAGRGTKGTHSRGSGKLPTGFEGGQMPLKRRQPKLPGFDIASRARRKDVEVAVVNVGALETAYEAGAEVTLDSLREKGLVHKRSDRVKILGEGELTKALTVRVGAISAAAHDKIESAGGTVEAPPAS
ncbi:MAG: 50S ribosomal protein L15 [Nitriliruptorales bacterium]